MHAPEQAESQQIPSAQKPERHGSAELQTAPGGSLPVHTPWSQYRPGAQSAELAQVVRQAPAAHLKSPQEVEMEEAAQTPDPLHSCAATRVSLSVQTGAPQLVPAGMLTLHSPEPLQEPSAPHWVPEAAHCDRGSLPASTGEQIPPETPV